MVSAAEAARFLDRATGCLVAADIGDAMGAVSEGLETEEIESRFGWVDDFEPGGTDDSLMRWLLCEALIESAGAATAEDWAVQWVRHQDRIRARQHRFFPSVLHTLSKLERGVSPRCVSAGNMPSSSSAMAIAPVGIVNAGSPRAAARQAECIAGLIHTGEVGFCQDGAAALAAAVAEALRPGATLASALAAATDHVGPIRGREMRERIGDALSLARGSGEFRAFRHAYHAAFRQRIACDSRETVPAALAIALLAGGDPCRAIALGANFGRDTDTIATMAASVCGALRGLCSLPQGWVAKAESAAEWSAADLARQLVRVAITRAEVQAAATRWMRCG